jgi:hypothetical protein
MESTDEHDWVVAQYPTPVVQLAGRFANVPQPMPEAPSKDSLCEKKSRLSRIELQQSLRTSYWEVASGLVAQFDAIMILVGVMVEICLNWPAPVPPTILSPRSEQVDAQKSKFSPVSSR